VILSRIDANVGARILARWTRIPPLRPAPHARPPGVAQSTMDAKIALATIVATISRRRTPRRARRSWHSEQTRWIAGDRDHQEHRGASQDEQLKTCSSRADIEPEAARTGPHPREGADRAGGSCHQRRRRRTAGGRPVHAYRQSPAHGRGGARRRSACARSRRRGSSSRDCYSGSQSYGSRRDHARDRNSEDEAG
jgi:hypothetical protein